MKELQADSPQVRQSACLVLMLLCAKESMNQLLYIACYDDNSRVREQAKQSLFSLGESGRKLYEENHLFANGFQGLGTKV